MGKLCIVFPSPLQQDLAQLSLSLAQLNPSLSSNAKSLNPYLPKAISCWAKQSSNLPKTLNIVQRCSSKYLILIKLEKSHNKTLKFKFLDILWEFNFTCKIEHILQAHSLKNVINNQVIKKYFTPVESWLCLGVQAGLL